MDLTDEKIKILRCDISARPCTAAGIEDVMPFVRDVRVANGEINISFDLIGELVVKSFVDAEQVCCRDLIWQLRRDIDALRLRIRGTNEQVVAIQEWFAP